MSERHVIIVGGGIAGLSAGCHALQNGFPATIVEHNLTLGGVCTAWKRGPYLVDGCIQWLTGGPFERLYGEVGIVPAVPLQTLETWITYRDAQSGVVVPITRDLDRLVDELAALAPEDRAELGRLREAARAIVSLQPPIDAAEVVPPRERLRALWESRGAVGSMLHFRKPAAQWAHDHLHNELTRRALGRLVPPSIPAFFLPMILGYLEKGFISRPVGGSAAFRDALAATFSRLGGEVMLHSTVDEILVEADAARGVRLTDGTILRGDAVLSTASSPETVLRLLGGRYDADDMRERLAHWELFDPIVLASFGVARAYGDSPSLLFVDRVEPFLLGGRMHDHLMVRVCNDDPAFAPPGHSVVQVMLETDYEWWATRGGLYQSEKDAAATIALRQLAPYFPEIETAVRMTDMATPLTFWGQTRSWRGAYEGWKATPETVFGHVDKRLAGLSDFYMAGQWMEPGGGIPMAVMSGRQAVQLLCADARRPFVPGGEKS